MNKSSNCIQRVMMVGSAQKSNGGVSTVLKTLKRSTIWDKYQCYWLETQIQSNKFVKLVYAIKSYIIAFFTIYKFDIVHFHTVPDISLIVQFPVFLLALLWKKKIILHLHVGNQIKDYKNNPLFHFCIKKSNKIILLSKRWEEIFKDYFYKYNVKTDFLYNACVPVNDIDYEYHKKTIIFAAHLNYNKGYRILLEAFSKIHKLYPDWNLIIMGDGEVDKAQKIAKGLDIINNVTFTGYIKGIEKELFFKEGGIYCMCSYKEGLPMVVLEAWAYGVPVITTPVGGLPEVLLDKKNALIFNFGDHNDLAEKLRYLINNYELRKNMSIFSKNFVQENFSLNIISMKLDLIYQSL